MRLKKILAAALAVTAMCTITLGAGLFSASGDGNPYEGFKIDGASIRNSNPTGLRFETSVPETLKNEEGYSFGTLIIPASILGNAELIKTTENVLDVKAEKWAEGENRFFAVLVGKGLTDFPESKYNEQIVARSYAENSDGEVVYYTDEITRSVAKVASEALAKGGFMEDNKQFLIDIVDGVIGEELKFDSSLVTVEKNAAYNLYDLFKTNNGNKGLTAIWEITEGADRCTKDGDTLTVTGDGVIVVKATIGSKTATAIINDVAPAMPQNLVLDTDTATLGWDACENAASYEVKVTCWNSNSTVYTGTVTENSVRISEEGLCGVYTAEVTAKSAHGAASETAVLKDVATYDNPDFNVYDETTGRKTLFRFTDEAALALVKQNTWKDGKNIANPIEDGSLTVSNGELSFVGGGECSGVDLKFNEPVSVESIISLYANVFIQKTRWYFTIVISDGTNVAHKTVYASNSTGDYSGKYYNYSLKMTDFTATDGGTMPSEISEIMIVTYQAGYNIKISEVSYTTLPSGFNEQNADESYTLLDFSTKEYKPYIAGGATFDVGTTNPGALTITKFNDAWANGTPLAYTLPKAIALSEIKTIKVKVSSTGSNLNIIYLVDATDSSKKNSFHTSMSSGVTKVEDGFIIDVSKATNVTNLGKIYLGCNIAGECNVQYFSITYTKNA